MRKREVAKELNRLGYDDERIKNALLDKPLTPDMDNDLLLVNNMKLKLHPDAQARVDQMEADRINAQEPSGSLIPKHSMHTIEQMILKEKPRNYSVEKVIDCITSYVIEGTYKASADANNVPVTTIKDWRDRKSWFNEVVNYIKSTQDHELEARMTEIVNATTKGLLSRIKDGDTGVHQGSVVYVENDSGDLVESKIPLSSDQLARIGAIFFDKRQISRGMSVKLASGQSGIQSIEEKLNKVAQAVLDVAQKLPKGTMIEVINR